MNDREFIQDSLIRHQIHLGQVSGNTPSPTGRDPKLLWSEKRQSIFNRMKEEESVWFKLIIDRANNDNVYADKGLWNALAFQTTGDKKYASQAWDRVQPFLNSPNNDDNNAREFSMEHVIVVDWCYPGWTPDQINQYLAALDRLFTNANTTTTRTIDSDQTTGVYFGVCFYNIAFGDTHPPARAFFDRAEIGGLQSTGRNRDTLRNSILDYVLMAEGGEWIESGEYNLGTTRLLLMGSVGAGIENFPEVKDWYTSGAARYAYMLTPDYKQSFQWGDEQEPHQLRVWPWTSTAAMFDDPVSRKVFMNFVSLVGATGVYSAQPIARSFLLFDPYGPIKDPDAIGFNSEGQGIISARTSHESDASMLCLHFPRNHPVGPVDHNVGYPNDVQLYRKKAWALTHPLTYGGVGLDGRGCNTMLHCGLGAPREFRGANEVKAEPSYIFAAGTCGGSYFISKSYQPPPIYLHEFSRSIIWLKGTYDTLVVFDRSYALDPRKLPGYTKYSSTLRTKMENAPVRNWRWHCPVSPTLFENTATWTIANGENARVTWMRSDLIPMIVDQSNLWGTSMLAREKKFHLDLTPFADETGFQTLITVLQFGDHLSFDTPVKIENGVRVNEKSIVFDHTPGPLLSGVYNPETQEILDNVRGDWSVNGSRRF